MNRARREIEAGMREEAEALLANLPIELDLQHQPASSIGIRGVGDSGLARKKTNFIVHWCLPMAVRFDQAGGARSRFGICAMRWTGFPSGKPGLIVRFGGHAGGGLNLAEQAIFRCFEMPL